jgi:hypothetical protein
MRPEDFPIGSIESRAAARRLAERRGTEASRLADVRVLWDVSAGMNASLDGAVSSINRYTQPNGRIVEIEFAPPN